MFNAIEFRGFKQEHAELLAKHSGIPVINGLTDDFHPTQALADVMTLHETFGKVKGLHWVYCGDGRNNVARSLMVISAKLGIHFTILSPKALFPDAAICAAICETAKKSDARIIVTDDVKDVKNADAVYTDVWVSMGEEAIKAERTKLLTPYQVNKELWEKLAGKESIFLHCLPAVKGEEVTGEIFESPRSRVFDQAENRKHTIKAIMLATI
jgi:ornithine carbamoyltransferase